MLTRPRIAAGPYITVDGSPYYTLEPSSRCSGASLGWYTRRFHAFKRLGSAQVFTHRFGQPSAPSHLICCDYLVRCGSLLFPSNASKRTSHLYLRDDIIQIGHRAGHDNKYTFKYCLHSMSKYNTYRRLVPCKLRWKCLSISPQELKFEGSPTKPWLGWEKGLIHCPV